MGGKRDRGFERNRTEGKGVSCFERHRREGREIVVMREIGVLRETGGSEER